MPQKRKIEVFSAGCPACEETITLVKDIACSSCEIEVLDMRLPKVAEQAKRYGINRVPAVVVDGQLSDCCKVPDLNETALRAAGVGVPLQMTCGDFWSRPRTMLALSNFALETNRFGEHRLICQLRGYDFRRAVSIP